MLFALSPVPSFFLSFLSRSFQCYTERHVLCTHTHTSTLSHTHNLQNTAHIRFSSLFCHFGAALFHFSLFAFSTVPFKFFWISFKVLFFWKRKLTIKCHSAICLFSCEISPKTHLNRNIFFIQKQREAKQQITHFECC